MSHRLKEVGQSAAPLALPSLSLFCSCVFTSLLIPPIRLHGADKSIMGSSGFGNQGEWHLRLGRASSLLGSLSVLAWLP